MGLDRGCQRRRSRVVAIRIEFAPAVGTDSMAELDLTVLADIELEVVPCAMLVTDLLARRADR